MEFVIDTSEEKKLIAGLDKRTDSEAARIKRYLAMPDLSRTPGSPLYELVQNARNIPVLKDFDNIIIPEIVPVDISFDLFNFAPDHPARSRSDTYFIDDNHILRPHDTVMWYYYLQLPEIKKKIAAKEPLGVMCYGKVFRKDEIDRHHMNIFHQMGGLYLVRDSERRVHIDELREALAEIVKGLFGPSTKYRFLDDTFPYTDPSLQVEVDVNGTWVEILGGGMPRKDVLANFGVTGYNGWAFGFGLERLAIIGMKLPDIRLLWSQDPRIVKQLKLGHVFTEVSKYPPVIRDISFVVGSDFVPNNYFDQVRDIAGDTAEEVALTDQYENEKKFGPGKKSFTYRITYRSLDRTLTDEEVNALHGELEKKTQELFGASIR